MDFKYHQTLVIGFCILVNLLSSCCAFSLVPPGLVPPNRIIVRHYDATTRPFRSGSLPLASAKTTSSSSTSSAASITHSVSKLKRVLEREYLSFFNPMERDFYASSVTFEDPLTDLEGVDQYDNNVQMLSGRNWVGALLFRDASITLHSVTGGEVVVDDADVVTIAPIVTRWTLRFTFQALPWAPSPRFSGISRYTVAPGGPEGVQVMKQQDYWDSINLLPGGTQYQAVDKMEAVRHFVQQLAPGSLEAPSAGAELPYQTLRIGRGGYEVRRYPAYTAARIVYERRDEAFSAMGSYTSGLSPMAPAIFEVSGVRKKTMLWPLDYAPPGELSPPALDPRIVERANASDGVLEVITVPSSVVAIIRFGDAIVEPVVRRVNKELRALLERDGLAAVSGESLMFAQYDAIFSMGQRRSEVHVPLSEHPW